MTNFNNQLIRNLENIPLENSAAEAPFSSDEVKNKILPKLARATSDPNLVVIPFITDTHYASDNYEDKDNARAHDLLSLGHITDFLDFVEKFKVDAVVHGGDLVDGKSTRSNTVADLRTTIGKLRGAKFTDKTNPASEKNEPVPALIAKGNHDDNVLATAFDGNTVYATGKSKIYSALDSKGVVKGSVLDPIFRSGVDSQNKVVFGIDKIKVQPFGPAYQPYMEKNEYAFVNKITVDLGLLSPANGEVLESMMATLTSTSAGGYGKAWPSTAAKTAFENLISLAKAGKKPSLTATITNSTTRKQVSDMIQESAKARLRGTYGHVDVKNVRLILLDAYDVPYDTYEYSGYDRLEFPIKDYAGYSAGQVKWFAETLKEAETLGYPVMIFGHHAFAGAGFTSDGGPAVLKGTDGDDYWIGNHELMKAILDDFVKGQSNTISTLDAIKIYSNQSSGSLAARANFKLNNAGTINAYKAYNQVSLAGFTYPHTTNSTISKKKAISDHEYMNTTVTTKFTKANQVIGVVTGHSHVERTVTDEYTKAYVNFMSNSSLIDGKLIKKGGWSEDSNTIPREVGEYTQNAWEVIVIDKTNKQVSIYPVGAGMINREKATGLIPTTEQRNNVMSTPQYLKGEGKFPVRRYNYATATVLEKGLQE